MCCVAKNICPQLEATYAYCALSFCAPQYGHLSLIMGEGNKKLSKRDGAASIRLQSAGYTREGLINTLHFWAGQTPNIEKSLASICSFKHLTQPAYMLQHHNLMPKTDGSTISSYSFTLQKPSRTLVNHFYSLLRSPTQ